MSNEYIEKLKEQMEIVLHGEKNLLESAHLNHVDLERVEQEIRGVLSRGVIFGTGDQIIDVMMAAYWLGRKDQYFASMHHLFGKEELEKVYGQICIKLGLTPKRLN